MDVVADTVRRILESAFAASPAAGGAGSVERHELLAQVLAAQQADEGGGAGEQSEETAAGDGHGRDKS